MYVSKDVSNHFLVHFNAKNSLKSAKNVVFPLFCILVDRPMEGAVASLPPWLCYWLALPPLRQNPLSTKKSRSTLCRFIFFRFLPVDSFLFSRTNQKNMPEMKAQLYKNPLCTQYLTPAPSFSSFEHEWNKKTSIGLTCFSANM